MFGDMATHAFHVLVVLSALRSLLVLSVPSKSSLSNPDYTIGQWIDPKTKHLVSIGQHQILMSERIKKGFQDEAGRDIRLYHSGMRDCLICRFFQPYHRNIMRMGESKCTNKTTGGNPCQLPDTWSSGLLFKITTPSVEDCPKFLVDPPRSALEIFYDEFIEGEHNEFIDNCGMVGSKMVPCRVDKRTNFEDALHFKVNLSPCPFAPTFAQRSWFVQSIQCIGRFTSDDGHSEYFVTKVAESEAWEQGDFFYNDDILRCFKIVPNVGEILLLQGFGSQCLGRDEQELTPDTAKRRLHLQHHPNPRPNLIPTWLARDAWITSIAYHDQDIAKFRQVQWLVMEGPQLELVGNAEKMMEFQRHQNVYMSNDHFKGVVRSNRDCIEWYHCFVANLVHSEGEDKIITFDIGLQSNLPDEVCRGIDMGIPGDLLLLKGTLKSRHGISLQEPSEPQESHIEANPRVESRQEKRLNADTNEANEVWAKIVRFNDEFMKKVNQTLRDGL